MKTALLISVKFYRQWISPILPGSCRFAPSCSEYAQLAIERHGSWRGVRLAAGRLLRCQPFHPGGYDPVPEKVQDSKFQISNSKYDPVPVWNLESGIWNLIQRKKHHG